MRCKALLSVAIISLVILIGDTHTLHSQTSGSSPCGTAVVTTVSGNNAICIIDHAAGNPIASLNYTYLSCGGTSIDVQIEDGCFDNIPCCPGTSMMSVHWTIQLAVGGTVSCSSMISIPECNDDPCEPDTDGDGVCDEDDCWPNDPNLTAGPGDPCDDGNPATVGDTYNFDCDCIGNPVDNEPCEPDTDGDGVCDEDDCWPNDPNVLLGPGDFCDDGDPMTYNDQYNDQCVCEGEPLDCGDINPDDGCPLTIDIVHADCTVTHLPPDPDDGCPLTLDYFDAATCTIVNEVPDVDDGCEGTVDVFDAYNCEIIHEYLPCDDGNPTTVGDKYDEDCVCSGCDPCQLQGDRWQLLCELLNR